MDTVKYIRVSTSEQNIERQNTDKTKYSKTYIDRCTGSIKLSERKSGKQLVSDVTSGMDKEVRMNGLRDGYVTRMRNEFGDNANFFTGHASSRVDKIHYYDDKELFEKVREFRLWKR